MSLDTLLLVVFFILIPLIQQWLRAQKEKEPARQPRASVPPPEWDDADMEDAGWETPVGLPPTPLPTSVPPPRPAEPAPARARTRDRQPSRPAEPIVVARPRASDDAIVVARAARVQRRQPRLSAAGLRTRADVRQAILQMTVLGPCRANLPYGADRPDGSPSSLSP